jgi:hypothetical protein
MANWTRYEHEEHHCWTPPAGAGTIFGPACEIDPDKRGIGQMPGKLRLEAFGQKTVAQIRTVPDIDERDLHNRIRP